MPRKQHIRNGRLLGVWYELPDGRKVYLGQRQMRHINRYYFGWTIDHGTLVRAKQNGVAYVGIVCRRKGKRHVWMSPIDDWFDDSKSFKTRSKKFGAERGIRLNHFMIDPGFDAEKINASFRIR